MFSNICSYLRESWNADLAHKEPPSLSANAKNILFNDLLKCNQASYENDIVGRLKGLEEPIKIARQEIAKEKVRFEKEEARRDIEFAELIERHKREQAMKK